MNLKTITHSLTIKVFGAMLFMIYEHNRPVFAKLEAEPNNPIEKHAIAVSSSNYENVGCIVG